MLSKIMKLLLLFVSITVLSVGVVASQGPPDGKGGGPPDGKGGGPPKPSMEERTGTVTLVDEVWVFVDGSNTMYNLDFGPEWYRPAPCLYGPLVLDEFAANVTVGDTVAIRFGPRVLGDFMCMTVDGGACTTVNATGKYTPRTYLPLEVRLPAETGEALTVWGRIEQKVDNPDTPVIERNLIRVWEINYASDGVWKFWRNEAEPWLKTQELACTAGGDE